MKSVDLYQRMNSVPNNSELLSQGEKKVWPLYKWQLIEGGILVVFQYSWCVEELGIRVVLC